MIITNLKSNMAKYNSIYDLGKPENVNDLNILQDLIIKFIDAPVTSMKDIFIEYCNPVDGKDSINYKIINTIEQFYLNTYNTVNNDTNAIYLNNIINKLSPYFSDMINKVLQCLKQCDPNNPNAYLMSEIIYGRLFQYNKTTVNMGLLDGITRFFTWVSDDKRHTLEIVITVIAVAFVASKIFDMFRVKVEV